MLNNDPVDPGQLAEERAEALNYMQDSCTTVAERQYTTPGTNTGGSDGMGGTTSSDSMGGIVTNLVDQNTYVCRYEGKLDGAGQVLVAGRPTQKTTAMLILPWNAILDNNMIVRVHTK